MATRLTTLGPVLTPHGRLLLSPVDDGPGLPADVSPRIEAAFARGSGHGLLQLGAGEVGTALPAAFGYWRDLGARYVTAVCTLPEAGDGEELAAVPAPSIDDLESLALAAPPMTGAEYLTAAALQRLWEALDTAFRSELAESGASVQLFLSRKSRAWHLVGRVHFNLAENRKDDEAPFAFLATYTTRLSAHAKAQHVPLGQALREYAGAANKARLLSLLLPVQRAAEQCAWLKAMVDAGEIYHPLRWTPAEAFQLLTDLPLLEAAGIVVRVPGTWRANRPLAAAGERDGWRQAAIRSWRGRAARFPDGGHAGRRALDCRRGSHAAGELEWTASRPRPLGGSESGEARDDARRVSSG